MSRAASCISNFTLTRMACFVLVTSAVFLVFTRRMSLAASFLHIFRLSTPLKTSPFLSVHASVEVCSLTARTGIVQHKLRFQRPEKKQSSVHGWPKKMRDQRKTCAYSRTAASHTPAENAWRQSGAVPGMGQEKHPGFFELGQRKYATRKKMVADTNA